MHYGTVGAPPPRSPPALHAEDAQPPERTLHQGQGQQVKLVETDYTDVATVEIVASADGAAALELSVGARSISLFSDDRVLLGVRANMNASALLFGIDAESHYVVVPRVEVGEALRVPVVARPERSKQQLGNCSLADEGVLEFSRLLPSGNQTVVDLCSAGRWQRLAWHEDIAGVVLGLTGDLVKELNMTGGRWCRASADGEALDCSYELPNEVQSRVSGGACANNTFMTWINEDGSIECVEPERPITDTPCPPNTFVVGVAQDGSLTCVEPEHPKPALEPEQIQLRITETPCPPNTFVVGVEQDGNLTCGKPPLEPEQIQLRITDTPCPPNTFVVGVEQDGSLTCVEPEHPKPALEPEQIQLRITETPCPPNTFVVGVEQDGNLTCTEPAHPEPPPEHGFLLFSSPGIHQFVVPSGIDRVLCRVQAGGGAGGSAPTIPSGESSQVCEAAAAGGGGGGGWLEAQVPVTPATVLEIIVGEGGSPSAGFFGSGTGGDGGFSSCGGVVVAQGGEGGSRLGPGAGGSTTAASSVTLIGSGLGQDGEAGASTSGGAVRTSGMGGGPGSGIRGHTPSVTSSTFAAGVNATVAGSGGSGAATTGSTCGSLGGEGANGFVLLIW